MTTTVFAMRTFMATHEDTTTMPDGVTRLRSRVWWDGWAALFETVVTVRKKGVRGAGRKYAPDVVTFHQVAGETDAGKSKCVRWAIRMHDKLAAETWERLVSEAKP